MQVFRLPSNNGDCSQGANQYRLTDYDSEVIFCSFDYYSRFFFKYSGANPYAWVSAARQRFSSFSLKQAGFCYDTYLATYSSSDGQSSYNVAFDVYRSAPFVAEVVASTNYYDLATVGNITHYVATDLESGRLMC